MRTILTVTALLAAVAASAQTPEEREPAETAREQPADVIDADGRGAAAEGETAVEAVVPAPAEDEPGGPAGGEARTGRFGEGSAEAGREKSTTCAACHGADGNSFNPDWPSLAGQHARYLIRQLEAYQSGTRQDLLMTPQAQNLSETDIRDLAAFYSRQTLQPRTADPTLARLGENIYRGGNPESGVSACIACHGPTGSGNPAAAYAMVRGQHAPYIAKTLTAYANGERRSDPNQIMRNIAVLLEDDELEAVASYMQGLRTN
ncbi:MAG TPA: c-type cytochrome [Gammaproteobacteria bacterium]|nr:c-type cytochrome [Gammaproteobacteria bacterium]